jgi:diguanylate cyclase (GGDEF)-like protein
MEKQLKTQSLPLSIDNIYTDIQKHIIEPYLVASMMANDTFMKDWLIHKEGDTLKIQKYLDSIKNRYDMLVSFLVSEKSQNYYTQNGLIEKMDKSSKNNKWYYKFKELEQKSEINLDLNHNISSSTIMFINFKILDDNFNYLGATGVGIKISYINKMLERFRRNYKLKVMFLYKNGNIILSENHQYGTIKNIRESEKYNNLKEFILSNESNQIEYIQKKSKYILNTKYIKELDIHLLVEAKLDDFTQDTKQNFYISLIISLLLTLIITIIIIKIVRDNNKKLNKLAMYDLLTDIPNRRNFENRLHECIEISRRDSKELTLLFMDIDNFKSINDRFGHKVGDEILKHIAYILKTNIYDNDFCARFGGEEFVLLFQNRNIDELYELAEKISSTLKDDTKITTLLGHGITASTGITTYEQGDSADDFIVRADRAMYKAKDEGKDRIIKL